MNRDALPGVGNKPYPHKLDSEVYWMPKHAQRDTVVIQSLLVRLGYKPHPWKAIDLDGALHHVPTLGEFHDFIVDTGIRHFSALEVCKPSQYGKAKAAGYSLLIPPKWLWGYAAVVLALADTCRVAVALPVEIAGLWRPNSYNRLVAKSGAKSDHPSACGADLIFESGALRAKAEGLLRGLMLLEPALKLSLGLGNIRMHVGALSPKGSRYWRYSSYRDPSSPIRVACKGDACGEEDEA